MILSVEAFNVLVLIPLAEFRLDKCPDPSIWDQVFVNNVDGSTGVCTCQMRVWECGIVNGVLRGNGWMCEWFILTPGSNPGQALALSHRGTFAQLDIGAVTRPNRRLVPVCPTPLDSPPTRE